VIEQVYSVQIIFSLLINFTGEIDLATVFASRDVKGFVNDPTSMPFFISLPADLSARDRWDAVSAQDLRHHHAMRPLGVSPE